MECLLKRARHLRRLAHGDRPLGNRLGDGFDVHRLKIFLVKPRARRLSGNAENGNRIGPRRVKPGDHVGARRPRGSDTHADVPGLGSRVALRHVRGAFDVARQHVIDPADFAHRRIQRIDCRAGQPECRAHALLQHHLDCRFNRSHLCHGHYSCNVVSPVANVFRLDVTQQQTRGANLAQERPGSPQAH